MNIEETLRYIHTINWRGSKLGLSRTIELLGKMGDPQKSLRFVHVAGTNGKGSTCARLAEILKRAGYKTGLYTSPYLDVFNERMRINGENISDDELCEITGYVKDFAEAMQDLPTEFELITAVAMEYFKRNACDIVVLEVGLGGELDSTNVIDTPEVAVITALGLDHTRELGPTIEDIARAKAGIIKKGGTVAFYGGEAAETKVIADKCAETGSLLRFATPGSADGFELGLAGTYQRKNAELVLAAVELLKLKGWEIPDAAVREGLAGVKWPGRFEKLLDSPRFYVDGGHNPHGVKGTAESLAFYHPDCKIHFIMGVMADKAVDEILDILCPMAADFVTVTPDNPRALPADKLAEMVRQRGITAIACPEVADGVRLAMDGAGEDDVICALGSLYMHKAVVDGLNAL